VRRSFLHPPQLREDIIQSPSFLRCAKASHPGESKPTKTLFLLVCETYALPSANSCTTFHYLRTRWVYLKVVQERIVKAGTVFCTLFSFLDTSTPEKKVLGNAQNLPLTHSNSELDANLTNRRVDATSTVLRNLLRTHSSR